MPLFGFRKAIAVADRETRYRELVERDAWHRADPAERGLLSAAYIRGELEALERPWHEFCRDVKARTQELQGGWVP